IWTTSVETAPGCSRPRSASIMVYDRYRYRSQALHSGKGSLDLVCLRLHCRAQLYAYNFHAQIDPPETDRGRLVEAAPSDRGDCQTVSFAHDDVGYRSGFS